MMDRPPDTPEEPFYSAALPVFAVMAGFGTLLCLIVIVLREGLRIDPIGLVFGVGGGLVTGLILTLVTIPYFPVYVSATGLRTYNVWGLYRLATWDQIASVGRFNLLGL